MKLTESQLKQLIVKEVKKALLNESVGQGDYLVIKTDEEPWSDSFGASIQKIESPDQFESAALDIFNILVKVEAIKTQEY